MWIRLESSPLSVIPKTRPPESRWVWEHWSWTDHASWPMVLQRVEIKLLGEERGWQQLRRSQKLSKSGESALNIHDASSSDEERSSIGKVLSNQSWDVKRARAAKFILAQRLAAIHEIVAIWMRRWAKIIVPKVDFESTSPLIQGIRTLIRIQTVIKSFLKMKISISF